jgi:hypothetical protein
VAAAIAVPTARARTKFFKNGIPAPKLTGALIKQYVRTNVNAWKFAESLAAPLVVDP